uniref:Uncharacterized protein n=1 Tax=Cacopsylla melanoneura TaxID=428564 RepID=A0A8D9DZE4_9HEMI
MFSEYCSRLEVLLRLVTSVLLLSIDCSFPKLLRVFSFSKLDSLELFDFCLAITSEVLTFCLKCFARGTLVCLSTTLLLVRVSIWLLVLLWSDTSFLTSSKVGFCSKLGAFSALS